MLLNKLLIHVHVITSVISVIQKVAVQFDSSIYDVMCLWFSPGEPLIADQRLSMGLNSN